MGAIDLVIQIEAPPSVASGMQRIGRAGHTIGAASRGVIVPKYRGDLVACAAVTRAMHEARIESTRYPRNPLDVLAQQIVAMVSMDSWPVDELYDALRRAAPFAELGRGAFEGVLDMLSGRYPSDDFADLRPRLTWDRLAGTLVGARRRQARRGHQRRHHPRSRPLRRLPHRRARTGGARRRARRRDGLREPRRRDVPARRVELARSRRSPTTACSSLPRPANRARCRSGTPTRPGRPLELGRHIGEMVRGLRQLPPARGDPAARCSITIWIRRRPRTWCATSPIRPRPPASSPTTARSCVERCRDELGDWRICVLSPFGGRIHAPWAMAVVERVRAPRPASTSRRCGPTTGSWCGFPRPTRRRTRR